MAKVNHIAHKKSAVSNKAPKAGDLANGEIAVNYADDTERMYIKNASGKIIPFSSTSISLSLTLMKACFKSVSSTLGIFTPYIIFINLP